MAKKQKRGEGSKDGERVVEKAKGGRGCVCLVEGAGAEHVEG
jgi:hypothetical protein